jgi:hypothetical protein
VYVVGPAALIVCCRWSVVGWYDGEPSVAAVGVVSWGPPVVGLAADVVSRGGDGRDPVERGGDLFGPGPGGGDAQRAAALPADEPGGGVQDAVAQPFRFGQGQLAIEGEQLEPGDEVGGDRGRDAPGLVDGELARG